MSGIDPADIETSKASHANIATTISYPIQGIDRKGNSRQASNTSYITLLDKLSAQHTVRHLVKNQKGVCDDMGKSLLERSEVARLLALLRDLFSIHDRHRGSDGLGRLIQYPKVPAILSESLVSHLINGGRVPELQGIATASKKGGDLDLIGDDGTVRTVEFKATGRAAFQYCSQKDIDADFLVWLHFGEYFHDAGQRTCRVFVSRTAANASTDRERLRWPGSAKHLIST